MIVHLQTLYDPEKAARYLDALPPPPLPFILPTDSDSDTVQSDLEFFATNPYFGDIYEFVYVTPGEGHAEEVHVGI